MKTYFKISINIVIAGMAVRTAVNQKNGENGTTAQLLPDSMGSSIRIKWWLVEYYEHTTAHILIIPLILTSGFLPANTLNLSNRRFRDS